MNKYLLATIFTAFCFSAQAQMLSSETPQARQIQPQAQKTSPSPANTSGQAGADKTATPQQNSTDSVQNILDRADSIYAGQIATAEAKNQSEREYDKTLKDNAERADTAERKETVRNLKALNNRYPELFQGGEDIDIQDTKAYTDYIKTKMTPPKEE